MLLKGLFWGSLGALAWTHVAYPAAAELAARARTRRVRKDPSAEPMVTALYLEPDIYRADYVPDARPEAPAPAGH